MAEYAVQQHMDPAVSGFLAEAAQVFLVAEHGIDTRIIARIIAVVAAGLEDRVEIQHGDVH